MENSSKPDSEIIKEKISIVESEIKDFEEQFTSLTKCALVLTSQKSFVKNIYHETCSLKYPKAKRAKDILALNEDGIGNHKFVPIPINSADELNELINEQAEKLNDIEIAIKATDKNINSVNYLIHCRKLHLFKLRHDYQFLIYGKTVAEAYWTTIKNEFNEAYKTFFTLTGLLGKFSWVKYFSGDIKETETANEIVKQNMLSIFFGQNLEEIISNRITEALKNSPNYEFFTDEEYKEKAQNLYKEVDKIFIDGSKRKIEDTDDEHEFYDVNPYDIESIERTVDKIIYHLRPDLRKIEPMEHQLNRVSNDFLYKAKNKIRISPDDAPEHSFKLFTGIEKIISRGGVQAYRFSYERFELDSDGRKFIPSDTAKLNRIFEPNSYSKEEIGLIDKTELEILKTKNNEQLELLRQKKSELESENETIPNKKTYRQIKNINGFIKSFKDWYGNKNLSAPSFEFEEETELNDEEIEPEESQRDKIRNYLKDNYPNFKNDNTNVSELASEITAYLYKALQGYKKKDKIESVRVELVNMRSGKIPLELSKK